jgi:NitT/TauT family transport system substrate-binding protein
MSFLPLLVAREQGFYREEGLDADLQQVRANVGQAALVAGEVDFTAALGSSVKMALQGAPLKVVMLYMESASMTLIARPDISTPAQLHGRTIGVGVAGASIDQVTRLVMKHYGLEPQQDVNIVPIGDGAVQYEALKLGQIDAAMMSLPFPILARREGYSIVVNAPDVLKFPTSGLTTHQTVLDQRRDMVRRVARSQIRALQFMRAQPDATIRLIVEHFEMDPETASDSYAYNLPAFTATGAVDRAAMEALLEQERAKGGVLPLTYDQIVDAAIVADAAGDLGIQP